MVALALKPLGAREKVKVLRAPLQRFRPPPLLSLVPRLAVAERRLLVKARVQELGPELWWEVRLELPLAKAKVKAKALELELKLGRSLQHKDKLRCSTPPRKQLLHLSSGGLDFTVPSTCGS